MICENCGQEIEGLYVKYDGKYFADRTATGASKNICTTRHRGASTEQSSKGKK